MNKQIKKDYIAFLSKQEGETRSYNEISADIELELWRAKMNSGYPAVVRIYTNMRLALERNSQS